MKKILLGIVLMLSTIAAFPQYITITPTYTPTSTNDWTLIYALAREAKAKKEADAYRKAEAKNNVLRAIGEIKQYIINALGQNIDETLRKQLNEDYNVIGELTTKIRKYGLRNDLLDELQWVIDDINDNIVSYNNRVAEARRQYEAAQIEAEAKPQEWTGTGFALNNGYVVTNYHVVEDAKSINISGVNGDFNNSYMASVVATDKVNDLAIIKINDSRFNGFGLLPYAINMKMAEVGDDIFVLGYPLTQTMGDEIKLTNGIISSRTGFQGDASLYQMTAPIQPGNSGGPMFDSKGNVVGIVCAHHVGTENVGYAIKTSYLKILAESSSLSNIFPTNNSVSTLPLSGQTKKLKKYVFLIKCSSKSNTTTNTTATDNNRTIQNPPISSSERNTNPATPSISTPSKGKTINNPRVKSSVTPDLLITSVTLSNAYTAITIHSSLSSYAWCSISEETYIVVNGNRQKLVRADGIKIMQGGDPTGTGKRDFTLYFPPIPATTSQIDLIELGKGSWKIYGINLQ